VRYSNYTVYRFDRQANGSWLARTQDEWHLDQFPGFTGGAATYRPRGQFIATDAAGNIYLSAGLWTCQTQDNCTDNAIVKYRPDGTLVTRFGRKVTGSWALGDSHGSFGGLAVTADGARVFVADINNSRVQRFDRAGDGTYGAVLAFGMNQQSDPNRWGACFADGVLAAPYDVTLSPRGEVLVASTSCYANAATYPNVAGGTIEVQRFTQGGAVRGDVTAISRDDDFIHGIAVDRSGNLHLVTGRMALAAPSATFDVGADAGGGGPLGGSSVIGGGGPAPDTTAPVLASVGAPASTTVNAIMLTVDASDAVGVTQTRVREDGVQGDWRAWSSAMSHTLVDRLGDHTLVVQVRDAAGNLSAERSIVVRRAAPPVTPAPKPAPTPTPTPIPTPTPTPTPAGDTSRPVITKLVLPAQVPPARSGRARTVVYAVVGARDDHGVAEVRFSTLDGRWGAWQPASGARRVMLTPGTGWRGVLVQVRDAAGNRSAAWYQPVLVAPRGSAWLKGTTGADRLRGARGTQHIDASNFDRGAIDQISCGAGVDTVLAQAEDVVARDCEHVQRVRMPAW
jgi:hypothetical protein